MNLSRHSLFTATATILAAWAACPPAEAALREANGTGVRIEVEYILPSAGSSVNELGTVGNFGTLHWVGRRSSNASGTVESTSEAPAVLFSGPASELTLANASVAENLSIGTVVGALAVTHMDNPTFSLTDDAGGRFAISGSNLATGAILDFEANATRTVTARATDPNGGFVEKAFSITIVDDDLEDADSDGLNEGEEEALGTSDLDADTDDDGFSDAKEKAAGSDPLNPNSIPAWLPTNLALAPGEVLENQPAGTFAGQLTFSDPDGNRTYAYALVADENQSTLDNSLFAIDANGSLSTTAELDYEAAAERRVRVQVTEDFNRTAAVTFTVRVLDLDEVAPVITLTGEANATHEAGTPWTEPGYTAVDAVDGDLTASVAVSGMPDANVSDVYLVTYSVSDSSGNSNSATRTVTVADTSSPVITLSGDADATITLGSTWVEPGYAASDTMDGDLTAYVAVSGVVDTNATGLYALFYSVSDSSGNSASAMRTVRVTEILFPSLVLLGDANVTIEAGTVYVDAGATWTDSVDGNGTVEANGTVNAMAPGTYFLTYGYTNSEGHAATPVTRTVTVVDTTPPVITLNGDTNVTHEAGTTYVDLGATWTDTLDGNGTLDANGTVNVMVPGIYVLSYDFTDATGNVAATVKRTVTVADSGTPVITLNGDANVTHEAGTAYVDLGATWTDTLDGNGTVEANGTVNANVPGVYVLSYDYSDSAGNAATTVTRTVTVADTTAPVISHADGSQAVPYDESEALGDVLTTTILKYVEGKAPADIGGRWTDLLDGNGSVQEDGTLTLFDLKSPQPITGVIDFGSLTPSTYFLLMDVSDAAGNAARTVVRMLEITDGKPPVITLNGDANMTHEAGTPYTDLKASWEDEVQGSGLLEATGTVNPNVPGVYVLTYDFTDSAGNAAATVTRTVTVADTTAPVISHADGSQAVPSDESEALGDVLTTTILKYVEGETPADIGGRWTDLLDGNGSVQEDGIFTLFDLKSPQPITGVIDFGSLTPSTYFLLMDVSDAAGNAARTVVRMLEITDGKPPVITLNGDMNVTHEAGTPYTDLKARWEDEVQGSGLLQANGTVNPNVPGVYVLSYDFTDNAGNAAATVKRTVTVGDTTVPVVTLNGDANVTHEAGVAYVDSGATWTDTLDGNGTLEATGAVNASVPGVYVLSYDYTDAAGNAAATVTRTVTVVDTTVPVITLNGDANITHEAGVSYVDLGATWTDTLDGNGTLEATGTVNASVPGVYVLSYDYTDAAGNAAVTVTRTVTVVDTTAPVITLNGDANVTHEAGVSYVDLGATWTDTLDGNGTLEATGTVNASVPGVYVLSYDYTDAAGNAAVTVTRTVTVVDTTAPVITLFGDTNFTHLAGTAYIDLGATWTDTLDGNGTVEATGTVNANLPGIYVLSYDYSDSAGNAATTVTRTVTVADTGAPVITLNGGANVTHEAGMTYVDLGATWTDTLDGNGTVEATGTVDANAPGVYVLSYNFTDAAGNAAATVKRMVTVADTTAPVISHADGAQAVPSDESEALGDVLTTTILKYVEGEAPADVGGRWTDLVDGNGSVQEDGTFTLFDLKSPQPITGVIDFGSLTPSTYFLLMDVSDAAGNAARTVVRMLEITDGKPPVITLNGDINVTHEAGTPYTELKARWEDEVQGSGLLLPAGTVNTNVPGIYVLTYDFTDAAGNAASTVTRTVTVADTTAPVITLNGDANVTHEAGVAYVDLGATWTDTLDGNGTLEATGAVNVDVPGVYVLTYDFTDAAGNAATTVTRTVTVSDTTVPVITLNGDANVTHEAGTAYIDAGATWTDALDGNGALEAVGSVDASVPGVYVLSYDYTDSAGNVAATVTRMVTVVDTGAPVITLNGDANVTHEAGMTYVDLGATWTDSLDGNGILEAIGTVDANAPGVYVLSYNFTDAAGNAAATVKRMVTVGDTTAPVISHADGSQAVPYDESEALGDILTTTILKYVEGKAPADVGGRWTDLVDGNGTVQEDGTFTLFDLKSPQPITGVIDFGSLTPSTYFLLMDVSDAAGNAARTVVRMLEITDGKPPVITLNGDMNATHEAGTPYTELKARWEDEVQGSGLLLPAGTVNTNVPGVYVLTYDFTDNAGNAAATVTRTVTVVDDPPSDLLLSSDSVEENLAAGTEVGRFSVIDSNVEAGIQSYVYLLLEGTENFEIDVDGTLRTKHVFDFESMEAYALKVRTTDVNGGVFEKAFEIKVNDAFVPIVETFAPRDGATDGTFILSGEVLDEGGISGSDSRGIVLGLSPDPLLEGEGVTVLDAGSGLGSFEATPRNLLAGKKYYYRAFASNAEGVAYGTQERFTAVEEPHGPSWAGALASAQADGWWTSPWFGDFFLSGNGWVRHESLGWLYAVDDGSGGVWLWQENLGWLWTGEGTFPYLYVNASGGWHYFLGDVSGRVFLYRFSDSEWVDVAEGEDRE